MTRFAICFALLSVSTRLVFANPVNCVGAWGSASTTGLPSSYQMNFGDFNVCQAGATSYSPSNALSSSADGPSYASASANGSATYGALHGYTQTITFAGIDSSDPANDFNPQGIGSSESVDSDQVTIVGPPGTQVKVLVTLGLDAILTRVGFPTSAEASSGSGAANTNLSLGIISSPTGDHLNQQLSVSSAFPNPDLGGIETATLSLHTGDVFDFFHSLTVTNNLLSGVIRDSSNNVIADYTNQQLTQTVDAEDTAVLFFDVQTPGITLETASGHSYSSPTSAAPEPTAAASSIVCLFLLYLSVLTRRRLGTLRT
jgi:hypothetical protein